MKKVTRGGLGGGPGGGDPFPVVTDITPRSSYSGGDSDIISRPHSADSRHSGGSNKETAKKQQHGGGKVLLSSWGDEKELFFAEPRETGFRAVEQRSDEEERQQREGEFLRQYMPVPSKMGRMAFEQDSSEDTLVLPPTTVPSHVPHYNVATVEVPNTATGWKPTPHPGICLRCANRPSELCLWCSDDCAKARLDESRVARAHGVNHLWKRAIRRAGGSKAVKMFIFRLWRNSHWSDKLRYRKMIGVVAKLQGRRIVGPFKAWQAFVSANRRKREGRVKQELQDKVHELESRIAKAEATSEELRAKNKELEGAASKSRKAKMLIDRLEQQVENLQTELESSRCLHEEANDACKEYFNVCTRLLNDATMHGREELLSLSDMHNRHDFRNLLSMRSRAIMELPPAPRGLRVAALPPLTQLELAETTPSILKKKTGDVEEESENERTKPQTLDQLRDVYGLEIFMPSNAAELLLLEWANWCSRQADESGSGTADGFPAHEHIAGFGKDEFGINQLARIVNTLLEASIDDYNVGRHSYLHGAAHDVIDDLEGEFAARRNALYAADDHGSSRRLTSVQTAGSGVTRSKLQTYQLQISNLLGRTADGADDEDGEQTKHCMKMVINSCLDLLCSPEDAIKVQDLVRGDENWAFAFLSFLMATSPGVRNPEAVRLAMDLVTDLDKCQHEWKTLAQKRNLARQELEQKLEIVDQQQSQQQSRHQARRNSAIMIAKSQGGDENQQEAAAAAAVEAIGNKVELRDPSWDMSSPEVEAADAVVEAANAMSRLRGQVEQARRGAEEGQWLWNRVLHIITSKNTSELTRRARGVAEFSGGVCTPHEKEEL